jgi:hypothetical protein
LSGAPIVRRAASGNPGGPGRRADWTGSKSAGDRTRPTHKFTRLNDVMDLGALLRNFFNSQLELRTTPTPWPHPEGEAKLRVSKDDPARTGRFRLLERPSRPLRGASGRGGWELRNLTFGAPTRRTARTGSRPDRFRFRSGRSQKRPRQKRSFRAAKRNVSHGMA